mgnify:CR=1 FL=1
MNWTERDWTELSHDWTDLSELKITWTEIENGQELDCDWFGLNKELNWSYNELNEEGMEMK